MLVQRSESQKPPGACLCPPHKSLSRALLTCRGKQGRGAGRKSQQFWSLTSPHPCSPGCVILPVSVSFAEVSSSGVSVTYHQNKWSRNWTWLRCGNWQGPQMDEPKLVRKGGWGCHKHLQILGQENRVPCFYVIKAVGYTISQGLSRLRPCAIQT